MKALACMPLLKIVGHSMMLDGVLRSEMACNSEHCKRTRKKEQHRDGMEPEDSH